MKYEKSFRLHHPETIGETDKEFDRANYTEWLEKRYEALTPIAVSQRSGQVCFCGAKQRVTCGDNRSYRVCENGHEK